MERIVTMKIDLEYPDEAHHAVDEAVKAYEADKLKWTEEEIAEAKQLALRVMNRLCIDGYSINWSPAKVEDSESSIFVWITSPDTDSLDCKTGVCVLHKSLWSLWIGKCIALYRATGKKLPQFILNKVGNEYA